MTQYLILKGINQIKTYISNTPRHIFYTSQYNFNFHDIKAKLTWKINQKFPMDFQTQKCPEKVQ
mgnify:CR=1 FL=1